VKAAQCRSSLLREVNASARLEDSLENLEITSKVQQKIQKETEATQQKK
jgi:hypothetical protein